MVDRHRAAAARHARDVRRHQVRVAGLRAQMIAGGTGAVVLGAASAASATAGSTGEMALTGALAAASGAWAVVVRRRGRRVEAHPPTAQLPPLPPARLRPGARGADQADRVANALLHLYDVIPSIGGLHPQAGAELAASVSLVDPLLRRQVERLASLDRIEWEMPGSRAAQAAAASGGEVAERLRVGADALEDLVAAAARMLAAPDLADGATDLLAPAIDSLDAFAHGLRAADASRMAHG